MPIGMFRKELKMGARVTLKLHFQFKDFQDGQKTMERMIIFSWDAFCLEMYDVFRSGI